MESGPAARVETARLNPSRHKTTSAFRQASLCLVFICATKESLPLPQWTHEFKKRLAALARTTGFGHACVPDFRTRASPQQASGFFFAAAHGDNRMPGLRRAAILHSDVTISDDQLNLRQIVQILVGPAIHHQYVSQLPRL